MPADVTFEAIWKLFQDTDQGFLKANEQFLETDHNLDHLEAIVTRTRHLARLMRY